MIYLDNLRMTNPSSKVKEKVAQLEKTPFHHDAPYFSDTHYLQEIDRALSVIYEFVGADDQDQFMQVSSTQEAFQEVLFQIVLKQMYETGKNFILTPVIEGASILGPLKMLEDLGIETISLPVNEKGQITTEILKESMTKKACLLALSLANPLTGVCQPIDEIAAFCKENGILLFASTSELFSKLFFKFRDLPIDFLAFSGEKFGGPRQSGGLFIKGGNKREKMALREVKNPITLMGMATALEEISEFMDTMCLEMARYREAFEEILLKKIPDIIFFGKGTKRLPNTSAFAIPYVHGELLLYYLKEKLVFATFGGGEEQRLEYILQEMNTSFFLSKCAISISMSNSTSFEEITKAANIIVDTALEIRSFTKDFHGKV